MTKTSANIYDNNNNWWTFHIDLKMTFTSPSAMAWGSVLSDLEIVTTEEGDTDTQEMLLALGMKGFDMLVEDFASSNSSSTIKFTTSTSENVGDTSLAESQTELVTTAGAGADATYEPAHFAALVDPNSDVTTFSPSDLTVTMSTPTETLSETLSETSTIVETLSSESISTMISSSDGSTILDILVDKTTNPVIQTTRLDVKITTTDFPESETASLPSAAPSSLKTSFFDDSRLTAIITAVSITTLVIIVIGIILFIILRYRKRLGCCDEYHYYKCWYLLCPCEVRFLTFYNEINNTWILSCLSCTAPCTLLPPGDPACLLWARLWLRLRRDAAVGGEERQERQDNKQPPVRAGDWLRHGDCGCRSRQDVIIIQTQDCIPGHQQQVQQRPGWAPPGSSQNHEARQPAAHGECQDWKHPKETEVIFFLYNQEHWFTQIYFSGVFGLDWTVRQMEAAVCLVLTGLQTCQMCSFHKQHQYIIENWNIFELC